MILNPDLKKLLKRILIIVSIVIGAGLLILLSYTLIVYFEFLSNKNSIFEKIDNFSKALAESNETDITLGAESEEEDGQLPGYFLDRYGNVIAKFSRGRHELIQLSRIPYYLSKGFILVEDKRFFRHGGINLFRIGLGTFRNILTFGHSPGGSTISQQLAKILFTNQKKNIKRKIYEVFCTLELEKRFTKNELLQIYLNSIYLGHGVYGIQNASGFYFGKDADELTLADAALLVGMNRSPERYSPVKFRENAERIQKVVMNIFVKNGFISKPEGELEIRRFWKRFDQFGGAAGNQSFWRTDINRSGYITEYIRQILEKEMTYDKITKGGLYVETTIDLDRQNVAEKVVAEQLKYIRKKTAEAIIKSKSAEYAKDEADFVEASLSSIDYHSGEILVLVGGSGYHFANQMNRAVRAHRPIGSSVKPFIYSAAFSKGALNDNTPIHPFTQFKDDIYTYTVNGKKYQPRNYYANHKYGNMVTIYDALKASLNTISVKVLSEMNINDAAEVIRNAAYLVSDSDRNRVPEVLSLALGTCELSTLELATGYSIFCRNGKSVFPVIIKKIYDAKGNIYYDYKKEYNPFFNDLYPNNCREEKEVIRPEASYELLQMMKSVFDEGGTGSWAAKMVGLKVSAYGKSGTTQEFRDGWFAGFTDNEVSSVWVGFDNNKPILLSGSSNAAIIWCDYNNRVAVNATEPIPRPANMKLKSICSETGLTAVKGCPSIKGFYFWADGPIPEKCYIHQDFE